MSSASSKETAAPGASCPAPESGTTETTVTANTTTTTGNHDTAEAATSEEATTTSTTTATTTDAAALPAAPLAAAAAAATADTVEQEQHRPPDGWRLPIKYRQAKAYMNGERPQQQQEQKKQKTVEEIKAEAREYALSSGGKKKIPLWQQQQKLYQAHLKKMALENVAALAYRNQQLLVGVSASASAASAGGGGGAAAAAAAVVVAGQAQNQHQQQQQQQQQPLPLLEATPQQQQQYAHMQLQMHHLAVTGGAAYIPDQFANHVHPATARIMQPLAGSKPPPAAAEPAALAAAGKASAVPHAVVLAQLSQNNNNVLNPHPPPTPPPTTVDELLNDKNLDDYTRFVKALSIEDAWEMFQGDDEEEDYQLDPKEGDDDDEEEEDDDDDGGDGDGDDNDDNDDEEGQEEGGRRKRPKVAHSSMDETLESASTATTTPIKVEVTKAAATAADGENAQSQGEDQHQQDDDKESSSSSSSQSKPHSPTSPGFNLPDDWDAAVYEELEQELGWLEEEDMEAAVATLLDNHPRKPKMDDDDSHINNSLLVSNMPMPFPTIITNNTNIEPPPAWLEPSRAAAVANGGAQGTVIASGIPATTAVATPATGDKPHHSTSFSPREILPPPSKRTSTRGSVGGAAAAAAAAAASRNMASTTVTNAQHDQLKDLMHKHYQLLIQQAVLAVRAAHYHKFNRSRMDRLDRTDFISGGETADDMAEILDAACGMLQDLDQNRKDSIRHFMQFHHHQPANKKKRNHHHVSATTMNPTAYAAPQTGAQRSLFTDEEDSGDDNDDADMDALGESQQAERRLTRAQFNKSLQEQDHGQQSESVFDIQGLWNLGETFATIDKSVVQNDNIEAVPLVKHQRPNQTMEMIQQALDGKSIAPGERYIATRDRVENRAEHLLETDSTEKACLMVLAKANVKYDKRMVPGARDVSENFVDPHEFLGSTFKPPCSKDEELLLRRNRNLFTSGEDNLVLRGVNLFGEKQWLLIADRFIPDRSVNIISQRYSKLCLMLYKANGVKIDASGNLEIPPKYETFDDMPSAVFKKLKPVAPPTVFNVHRWSLEEDLTLLKAVPKMGHMWAELGTRLIPHRDRGHLRKRYQVLERRIKAATARSKKSEEAKGTKAAPPKVSSVLPRLSAPRGSMVAPATQQFRKSKVVYEKFFTPTTPAPAKPPRAHAHLPPAAYAHSSPLPLAHAYARSPPHAYPPPPPHAHALSPVAYSHAPYPYHPHYMYPAPHYPHLYSPGYPPPPYSPAHHMPYPHPYHPPGHPPPAQSPQSGPAPEPSPPGRPSLPTAALPETAHKTIMASRDPESGSRAAFERLLLANDTDTLLVASAMATDLARGPAKVAVKAPTTTAPVAASAKATNASNTGKQTHSPSPSKNVEKGAGLEDLTDSTSFLAGVLERVGQADLSRGGGSNSMGLGNGNNGKPSASKMPSRGQFASTEMETPSKRARISLLSTKNTPKQDHGVFPDTPSGLSPHLEATPPSTSVSISSLAQGSSHRMFTGTPGKSLFGDNNGTSLMENSDLEAISALNLLGTSPEDLLNGGSQRRASDASGIGGTTAAPRKSLFAQVVHGAAATTTAPAPAAPPVVHQNNKKRNSPF